MRTHAWAAHRLCSDVPACVSSSCIHVLGWQLPVDCSNSAALLCFCMRGLGREAVVAAED